MKKFLLFLLPLVLLACNNNQQAPQKMGLQSLSPGQKDSVAIVGTDTVHFTGTPYNVTYYNWVVSSVSSGTTPPPTPPTYTFTFNPISTEVYNGGRGLNNFFGSQAFNYPASDNYTRFSWAQLQTGATSFTWSALDNALKAAQSSGQKLMFRVGCVDNTAIGGYVTIGSQKSCYPAFVHNAMQSESVKDWTDGTWWYPNWNSNSFLTYWEGLQKAIADHLTGFPNVVYSMDIGGYGNFLAEWHMYGINEPAACKATDASQIRIIQSHLTYFPNIPLIANEATYDTRFCSDNVAGFAITAKNNFGPLGFRTDHMGWYQTTAFDKNMMNRVVNGVNILAQVQQLRKFSPCQGEPMNSSSGITPPSGTPYSTVPDEVNFYGIGNFSNEAGDKTAPAQNNILNASRISGYTIALTTAVVSGNILTLNWINKGVAPTYENWDVYLIQNGQQVKSSMNLRGLISGTGISIDTLQSGSYQLSIVVKDRTGYRPPMNLAITGRQSDGSYVVGAITVK